MRDGKSNALWSERLGKDISIPKDNQTPVQLLQECFSVPSFESGCESARGEMCREAQSEDKNIKKSTAISHIC